MTEGKSTLMPIRWENTQFRTVKAPTRETEIFGVTSQQKSTEVLHCIRGITLARRSSLLALPLSTPQERERFGPVAEAASANVAHGLA
jgi:vancomycin permeability regulator SanA